MFFSEKWLELKRKRIKNKIKCLWIVKRNDRESKGIKEQWNKQR